MKFISHHAIVKLLNMDSLEFIQNILESLASKLFIGRFVGLKLVENFNFFNFFVIFIKIKLKAATITNSEPQQSSYTSSDCSTFQIPAHGWIKFAVLRPKKQKTLAEIMWNIKKCLKSFQMDQKLVQK